MSLYGVQKFLFHLNRDARVQQRYKDDMIALLQEYELTGEERESLARAVAALADTPVEARTIGTLRVYLRNDDGDGLSARLKRWEAGEPLGWVFDNEIDEVPVGVEFSGYDMTDFLDHPEIRSPLMMYLFRRIEDMIDGRATAACSGLF